MLGRARRGASAVAGGLRAAVPRTGPTGCGEVGHRCDDRAEGVSRHCSSNAAGSWLTVECSQCWRSKPQKANKQQMESARGEWHEVDRGKSGGGAILRADGAVRGSG